MVGHFPATGTSRSTRHFAGLFWARSRFGQWGAAGNPPCDGSPFYGPGSWPTRDRADQLAEPLFDNPPCADRSPNGLLPPEERRRAMSSLKFVVSSLDIIAAHAGRNKQLAELAEKALAAIKENDQQLPDAEVVFAPLQLATKSGTIPLATTALDCIGKLISYSYFSSPSSSADQDGAERAPLIERAIDTICDCFQGEATLVEVQLQIVKSLLAAVLNDKIIVHGAGLLKAVRQVYNIFLLSRSTANQQVAQGTLTQMVGTVFERVKTRLHMKEARANLNKLKASRSNLAVDRIDDQDDGDDQDSQADKADSEGPSETVSDTPPSNTVDETAGKLTLKDLEHRKSFEPHELRQGIKYYHLLEYHPATNEIEVFLNEIYLALLARRNAPSSQKLTFVGILKRLCEDPRALVEMYLNYDCDRNVDNIFQRIVEDLSRFATASVPINPIQEQQYEDHHSKSGPGGEWQIKSVLPPALSVALIATHHETDGEIPKEYVMKRAALDSLVETLRSLVHWSQPGRPEANGAVVDVQRRASSDDLRDSIDPSASETASRMETPIAPSTPVIDDDPDQLEKEKARKTAMTNAIKVFNFKPKHGIKLLLKEGFISSDSSEDIARFLLRDDRLDKAQIGEYLGEGDQKNVDIMHAFVDMMDFTKKRFVDALREFLQAFRLPGEAQKIDRFMLKFAHRYVTGNPNAFANADTPYVLAYSVILLNTDLHSSKVVKRMTKDDFIKNNRGINDNADLPDEYLIGIYEDIQRNEIVLKSEREAAAASGMLQAQTTGLAAGLGQAFSNVGRDLQREAYVQQSEEISLRSEQLFRDLYRSQRKSAEKAGVKFISATSFKHVGPMFDATWMSFFSALSSLIQKTHNLDVNKLCLEGMKLATKIACLFELATPREAFISVFKNTANLNNPREMQAKNVEALKVLLELAQTEGNHLKESWKDVLMCISQLDRLQLISGGVDESAVPDVSRARFVPPPQRTETTDPRKSTSSARKNRPRAHTGPQGVSLEIALESRSDDVIKSVDRIFTNTANLSRDAIIHFARALTEVSWDEIRVSGSNDSPRTYSLQKIVEISYYNMTRVRFEWSHIWDVLGEHFNKVGCHANTAIVFFALDSLRQLSMRFMEIEELAGFKFQKDFLKPFEHVMSNSSNVTVKDMILRCLIQMIQARGENIRSGWRTMFGVFTVAAREQYESIVNLAYENVTQVYKTRFGVVISQGAFTDLIVCLTEFSKNMRFQKKSLQAMEMLKSIIPTMLKTPECPLSQKSAGGAGHSEPNPKSPAQQTRTSVEEGFWFPVLFAFHDVLMTGEDLEVRSNALNYFFETLLRYGGDFPSEFWDILWRQQLYPIFMVLRSRPEMTNALNHEELSVWLSTTMIQALRNMITLFTHYFEALEYMLDRFLELLALCICQENDTIARIGSNCLQQLILQNVTKFTPEHWAKIVGAFCELFERTTAYQLFSATTINSTASLSPPPSGLELGVALSPTSETGPVDEKSLKINGAETNGHSPPLESTEVDPDSITGPATANPAAMSATPQPQTPSQQLEEFKPTTSLQQQPVVVTAARRRFFNRIISRCVLQLLMIETVNELFSNDAVYAQIPSPELLRLMALLKKSFLFAKRFNADKDLRMRLWREGFMKQPPNLLKQESGSAATYVSILFRMFGDTAPERQGSKADVESALVPLCQDIIRGYIGLDEESQHRNIVAWRPVVVDVLEGYAAFPREAFVAHIKSFYPLVVELLGKDLGQELRAALLLVLRRVGEVGLGIEGMVGGATAVSGNGADGRRNSVLSVPSVRPSPSMDSLSDDPSRQFMGRA
ncbi:hypothetical protein CHGG_05131 [Chaetomium globosum CBS 148.51]|uniref:SEC7 domain-containing protein n=1 Tax=Chaetomium globosum (strain ATCC 6205 / CBS 148.51 / DSM 1962 / NBRC 6347 / NRRL 1970) TaxID=306901 RepID=Q2GZB5_CHAGB|nr:uncharacterized protein CHGG_05131 [Chaetomium globosum CBS 148.51]EAQ88512.1 hypothetical protein CHGG_05131 [Chaetomium globosum CBS 148.51]